MRVIIFVWGTAVVLLSQFIIAGALAGVGLLLRRAYGLTRLSLDDLFDAFWLGFSAVILALLLWNFIFAVNEAMLGLVLLAGMAGWLLQRRALGTALATVPAVPVLARFGFLAAALWIANQGLGAMQYFDSALYHMQSVEWAKAYPVVPGLANLSAPLAYNNAGLLYGAMLDSGPWAGMGFRLANGVLMQVLLLRIVLAITRLTRRGLAAASHEVFVALLLPAAISLSFFDRLSSYATAASTAIVVLVVAERMYAFLAGPQTNPRQQSFDVFVIVALSATCVALKLSAAVFSAVIVVSTLAVWWRRGETAGESRRVLAYSLGFALLIGAAWTARGVVLSGYPAFPSTLLAAPVDWRAPAEHARAEYALVEHSSKASTMLEDVIAGEDPWGWLPRWTKVNLGEPFFVFVPLALALVLGAVARRRGSSSGDRLTGRLMALPLLLTLGIWFVTAPEGRYAAGFCWALAALAGARALGAHASGDDASRSRRGIAVAALVVAGLTMVLTPAIAARREAPDALIKTVIKQNVRLWESPSWRSPIQAPALDTFVTASGLRLGVPPDRCWNAAIPCTPNPAANLELRTAPDLRGGFRVRGAWAMQNWPSRTRPRFLSAWRRGQHGS